MDKSSNPFNLISSHKYRKKHKKNLFPYFGFKVFFGKYGSGKTLSCVDDAIKILDKYPNVVLITNTVIYGICNKTHYFRNADELVNILLTIDFDNPAYGYVIFVDEIAVVFKDLFYSSYSADFVTFLTQVRKLGIYFLGTAQLWSKCDKTVRDYFRTNGQVVFNFSPFPGLTVQKYVDMSTCSEDSKNNLVYNVQKSVNFYHYPELYERYNTFAVISSIKNIGKKGVLNYGN